MMIVALVVVAVLAVLSTTASTDNIDIAYSTSNYWVDIRAENITGYLMHPFPSVKSWADLDFHFGSIVNVTGVVYGPSPDANAILNELTAEVDRLSEHFIRNGHLDVQAGDFGLRVEFQPLMPEDPYYSFNFNPIGNWIMLLVFKRVDTAPSNSRRFALRSQAIKISANEKDSNNGPFVGVWAIPSADTDTDSSDWNSDIYKPGVFVDDYDLAQQSCTGYNCSRSYLDFTSPSSSYSRIRLTFIQLEVLAQLNGSAIDDGEIGGSSHLCYGQCRMDVMHHRYRPSRSHGYSYHHHFWQSFPSLPRLIHWILIGIAIYMVATVLRRWRREWLERKRQETQEAKVVYIAPNAGADGANPSGDSLPPPLYITPPPLYSVRDNVDTVAAEKSDIDQLAFI